MGYLDSSTITVDAILTKRGRELLALNDGSFRITQFALGDDEIDYTMFNENHPNGSQYSGEAIENMPILEAFPNELQTMKYKLVTLPRSTVVMPTLRPGTGAGIEITTGESITITPQTQTFSGTSAEAEGYTATFSNITYATFNGGGTGSNPDLNSNQTLGTNVSKTVTGMNFTLIGTSINIFGSLNILYATLTIVGRGTGARIQVPFQITRAAGL